MLHINLDDMNIFQRQTNKYYIYRVGWKEIKFNFNIHFAWRGIRHDNTFLEEQVLRKARNHWWEGIYVKSAERWYYRSTVCTPLPHADCTVSFKIVCSLHLLERFHYTHKRKSNIFFCCKGRCTVIMIIPLKLDSLFNFLLLSPNCYL